ncbi:helix-turn-helix domain-containing protein [Tenacibaculum maritimum]|nr:helix-turn-helix domain-containing protein [Tenacibaculum maritimum]MDB0599874.1 helix-turn-helix domain-containing protein [Tenacibaculum maritimum]MDB0610985.1 helix-turn-helix domain-containing protein [Tenacibaculum maritimum]
MQSIQFIQVTPEQLQNSIIESVKIQLNDLKNHFQPKEPTEYLTRQETADLLKVDLSTIHNYTKQGKLISYGIGSRVYYKRKEVETAITKLTK